MLNAILVWLSDFWNALLFRVPLASSAQYQSAALQEDDFEIVDRAPSVQEIPFCRHLASIDDDRYLHVCGEDDRD